MGWSSWNSAKMFDTHKSRMIELSCSEKTMTICQVVSTEYRNVTDRQTDGQNCYMYINIVLRDKLRDEIVHRCKHRASSASSERTWEETPRRHKGRTLSLSAADSKCLQEPPWTWHRSIYPCVTWRCYNCLLSCLLAVSDLNGSPHSYRCYCIFWSCVFRPTFWSPVSTKWYLLFLSHGFVALVISKLASFNNY